MPAPMKARRAPVPRLAHHVFVLSGTLMLIGPVAFELDPANLITGRFSQSQFLAFELFAALTAFWSHRAAHAREPWRRMAASATAMLAVAICFWIVRFLGTDEAVFLTASPLVVAIGCASVAMILLASRVAAGTVLALIVAGFLAFGYAGQFMPQVMPAASVRFSSYVTYLVYGPSGLLGRAMDIITNVVLVFVIFGAFFEVSGGGRVIANIALGMARNSRSGAIKACVVASGLFGTISGAATSNVMTSGAFTIPAMRKIGVRNETAAGIEAAASTCGQIVPPVLGAAAFFLADLAGVSYAAVVLAAIIPALACYFAFFRQADLVDLPPDSDASVLTVEPFETWWLLFLLPPAIIAAFLVRSDAFVSLAAIAGATACFVISLVVLGPRASLRRHRDRLGDLIVSAMHLLVAAAAIGLLLGVLNATGVAVAAAVDIARLGEQSLFLALVLTAATTFVLGMGMATVGVYIVAATLLTPGLIDAGVPPLAAHFFVLYCGILSMITPPVAFAALAASALARSGFLATSCEAMRFGWMLFVMPFLIVLKPGLLLLGSWAEIALAVLVTFAFLASATAAGMSRVLKLALVSISLGALLWPGPGWVAFGAAMPVVAYVCAGPIWRRGGRAISTGG